MYSTQLLTMVSLLPSPLFLEPWSNLCSIYLVAFPFYLQKILKICTQPNQIYWFSRLSSTHPYYALFYSCSSNYILHFKERLSEFSHFNQLLIGKVYPDHSVWSPLKILSKLFKIITLKFVWLYILSLNIISQHLKNHVI